MCKTTSFVNVGTTRNEHLNISQIILTLRNQQVAAGQLPQFYIQGHHWLLIDQLLLQGMTMLQVGEVMPSSSF